MGGQVAQEVIDNYSVIKKGVSLNVVIYKTEVDYIPMYDIKFPELGEGTKIILSTIRTELLSKLKLTMTDLLDPKSYKKLEE